MDSSRTAKAGEERVPAQMQNFLVAHTHCLLCETELEIHHEINLKEKKVKEDAYCPRCGVKTRSQVHSVH